MLRVYLASMSAAQRLLKLTSNYLVPNNLLLLGHNPRPQALTLNMQMSIAHLEQ